MSDPSSELSSSPDAPYPDVDPRVDLPALERAVLERWEAEGTFERSVEERPADLAVAGGANAGNEYVFYDGPPFANGLPHYGHLLTGYVKDVVPRYQTMRGLRVERRFGWDCHGLPAEMIVEKELGVAGRAAITEYGIDRFNETCHSSVLRFTAEWKRYVTRQARWADFDDDYKTLDTTYMESVIWAFRQLWDKGLVYEAYRVMPYSWGAETPLSNFEIRLDDAMRPRQDPALTVAFTLEPRDGDPAPMRALAWTTTPWTLPANLALAVGDDLDYDLVEIDAADLDPAQNTTADGPVVYVIGSAVRERYERELGQGRVVGTVKGAALVDRTYEPLFGYFAGRPNSFRVLAGDFVDTEEGTGIVHIAPGHGEDDQRVGEAAGIELVSPVDDAGRYTDEVPDWAGVNVFDANPDIIRHLKERGLVLRHETYDHNYAHCWRTDTPIIYKAVSSWYVRVTDFKDRMVAHNQDINWIPSHVRDGQFGRWLEGARDWSISRNRFWGAPIPVWRSDDPAYPRVDVYGSLDELERDFGVRPTDLHRPMIDELVRPNPDDPTGASMMRRVPEVLDCWFESGSMPFAQVHYPFENKDWFDTHAPADFIVEYMAQTRGWFYTLHVLSTALFDRPAFRNVICHGIVLDVEGRKLSKRLRNYPDPVEVMETIGSDPLRWYLMASPILRGGDLRIRKDAKDFADVVRLVVNPIWNAYSFFCRYANVDGYRARTIGDASGVLDRYLLAKTRTLVEDVTQAMDDYDIAGACHQIQAYLDALTNWYIRRSRDRFWSPGTAAEGMSETKREGYDALFTALTTLVRLAAPLLPMVTEEIYSGLHDGDSVHLADWPDAGELVDDRELVRQMDEVRAVCSAALALREETGLRVRLPLPALTVAGSEAPALTPFRDLIADELNVKSVCLEVDSSALGNYVLRPNAKVLGPKVGGAVQQILAAARSGEWSSNDDGTVDVAGHTLAEGEFELALQPAEGRHTAAVRMLDPEGRTVDLGLVVDLDTDVTPELEAEGLARDLIRLVQQLRKERDLDVTDRISLRLTVPDRLAAAVRANESAVAGATLATSVTFVDDLATTLRVDGDEIGIELEVV
ncbi:MAG TPA: isoleucine--tRNA ligase [Microthrixaceae bacterium]|nr:isoleucine--tRNA ligase [Microthrixaceae bacterium]